MAPSIDWSSVRRVLVVRLRSIGDTVLATPTLEALRRSLPDSEIDILLEQHIAPVLDGYKGVNVVVVGDGNAAKLKAARYLRSRRYDVAINLHGGTTSSIFVRASGARHRIGYSHYRYPRVYTELYASAADMWGTADIHSAEQQLALVGLAGIAVDDRPGSQLVVTEAAADEIDGRIVSLPHERFAMMHPAAAYFTKEWPLDGFARVSEFLASNGFSVVAVASESESAVLNELKLRSQAPVVTFDDLRLPEITALASRARLFIGNDSGIAHIAAAVGTPSVVIFGSSNRTHWRPWTDAPNEVVFAPYECQPCPGYECKVFSDAPCIRSITPHAVNSAVERVLSASKG